MQNPELVLVIGWCANMLFQKMETSMMASHSLSNGPCGLLQLHVYFYSNNHYLFDTILRCYFYQVARRSISCRATSLNMPKLWQWSRQRTLKVGRAEFLSRPKNVSPFGNQWNALRNSFAWSDSPVK
nr:transmembrane protein 194 [Tanacetum cinerariifolium]